MNSITIKVLLNLWTKTIANIEKSAIFYLLFKFWFDFKHPNLYIKKTDYACFYFGNCFCVKNMSIIT